MIARITALATALCTAQTLSAQEGGNLITAEVGIGPNAQPAYFGSDMMVMSPTGSFRLERLQLWGLTVGGEDTKGLGFGGSIRLVDKRDADEYDELEGLETVDASVELGGGLRYYGEGYSMFADLRYGVVGHESWVAEVGGDLIHEVSPKLTLRAGPRLFWGDDDYAQTYYGVSADESAASDFAAYDASGGLLGAGVQLTAMYKLQNDWGVTGTLRYDQLQGDAADSPITQSEDQFGVSVVLTRRVTVRF